MSKNATLDAECGEFSYRIVLNKNEPVSTPLTYHRLDCHVGDKHPKFDFKSDPIDIPLLARDVCKTGRLVKKGDVSTYVEHNHGKSRTGRETYYAKIYWKDGCALEGGSGEQDPNRLGGGGDTRYECTNGFIPTMVGCDAKDLGRGGTFQVGCLVFETGGKR
jgi:hypothetical protein